MTAETDQHNDPAQQNLFGICARVGEDFGFNPLWLRLAFAAVLILNPVAVIAAYFALGAVVLTSRLIFPPRAPKSVAAPAAVPVLAATPVPQIAVALDQATAEVRDNGADQPRMPLAA